jgi:hypothetical protein
MDALEKLTAIEDIRALVARRVRCLDEKDWDGFADCYAEDGISYSFQNAEGKETGVVGSRAIADRVGTSLQGVTTVHQIHLPEIDVLAPDSATGIVPLMDFLFWEKDGERHWLRGFGHYRQTFAKKDGRWWIAEHRLTRLKVESGAGDEDTLHQRSLAAAKA